MTSTWSLVSGSTGTKWSSPRSDAPLAPMPSSWMRTRLTSRPRMIGRLEAPGAKLDPVMPGFSNKRSPSVDAPLRRNSAFGTTVMVANWSVTIGIVPTKSPAPVQQVSSEQAASGQAEQVQGVPARGGLGLRR